MTAASVARTCRLPAAWMARTAAAPLGAHEFPRWQVNFVNRNHAKVECQARLGGTATRPAPGVPVGSRPHPGSDERDHLSLDLERDEEIARDLRDTQARIDELAPRLAATRERLSRASVRAPATGRVMDSSVFTVVGVASPGQTLMEIVPQARGIQTGLQAGLPVEILIPLKKRTALTYLLEPLAASFWRAGREH